MQLSTRSRYGLKAVVDLAVCYGEGPVTLSYLAAQQGISEAYLELLLRSLKKSGMIETSRGAQGGYALSRSPEEISVQDVLQVLEGSTALVDCVGTDPHDCENACSCSARPLFLRLQSRINEVLKDTTIRDLMEENIQQKRRLKHAKSLS
jgi:Rrf2 family protein